MPTRRRGAILIAMMIVTVLAAMVAAGLLYRVQAETSAASSTGHGEHAYQAAMSGVQMVMAVLQPPEETADAGAATGEGQQSQSAFNPLVLQVIDDPTIWSDNPDLFRNRLVYDDGVNRWYFTIYSFNASDKDNVRYGLTDEGGKINLNTADAAVLGRLPNMTPELVDALLDFRDPDDEPRENGAEQEYYDQLAQPYLIKNGPFATVDEVLLVRGFSSSILFGEDANLNGLLEPNEDDGEESFPPDDNDGQLNTGLHGATTTLSTTLELDSEGGRKIDLNRANAGQLREAGLSNEAAQFVEYYRGDGGRFIHPSQLLNMEHTLRRDVGGGGGGRGGRGRRGGNRGPRAGQTIRSGVTADDMPAILDKLTTVPGGGRAPVPGLVNVNSATAPVLTALGIDSGVAQQIVEARPNLDEEARKTPAWLLTEGFLDEDAFKSVAPRLTIRGFQYRMRIIGFGVPSGRYRILEAVIDLASGQPRVVYLRDITRMGAPFPLNPEDEEL